MKIRLVNTPTGFVPETDDDYEVKRKMKVGKVYEATIKEVRNPKFLRLYFSLINIAWEYLTEQQQAFFYNNKESFRKTLEVAAGHFELVYSRSRNEWLEMPKSIAFDAITEQEFSDLFERVKTTLYQQFILDINKEEFEKELKWY